MPFVPWDTIPQANDDNKRRADVLILTEDGRERRAVYNGGWMYLHDAADTIESPQSIPALTDTLLTIDGLASDSTTEFRRGIPLDTWSENTLRPSATGEAYAINFTMNIAKETSASTFVDVKVKIGSTYTTLVSQDRRPLVKDSGTHDFLFFSGNVFITDAFTLNGGRFFMNAQHDVTVWNKAIYLQRTHSP